MTVCVRLHITTFSNHMMVESGRCFIPVMLLPLRCIGVGVMLEEVWSYVWFTVPVFSMACALVKVADGPVLSRCTVLLQPKCFIKSHFI